MISQRLKYLLSFFLIAFMAYTQPSFSLEKGFVYLDQVDPTIQASLRYCGTQNFAGRPIKGYLAPRVILTEQAAQALKKAQIVFSQEGFQGKKYSIVVYDASRPQDAVDDFYQWSQNPADQAMKAWFYPREDKEKLFDRGYIAQKSGHSRGSTVDITLISLGKTVKEIIPQKRLLKDGFEIFYLDDGTVDMGTSFDVFDISSHYKSSLIESAHQELRDFLKQTMQDCGFKNYAEEWWHFTLENEPFPSTYHNFPIQ